MDLEKFKSIIQRYLDGKLPKEENKNVDGWYDAVSKDEIAPFTNDEHKARVKQAIFSRFPPSIQETRKQVGVIRLRWLSAVASVILLGVFGLLFFYQNPQALFRSNAVESISLTQISTHPGETRELRLPDSSSIFLSGNAQVRFDEHHYHENRKIYLDKGEAFFSVQRDTVHPFSIETGTLSIRVLGTSFNVNNSEKSKYITVDVKTGKVSVGNRQEESLYILTAGKSVRYDKESARYKLFDSDPTYANIWIRGGILLNGATFEELCELIYNRYGLTLRTDNIDTDTFSYSVLMPHVQSIDQLLHMICNIHQINFRRERNEIILYK